MRLILALLLSADALIAQTTVYLRDNPAGSQIISPGCTNATPTVCTVVDASKFTTGHFATVGGSAP